MSRFSAAHARAHLAEVLDTAEQGQPVVIERRGVRFRLVVDKPARAAKVPEPIIEMLDPAVERGQWSWAWGAKGLRFSGKRQKA